MYNWQQTLVTIDWLLIILYALIGVLLWVLGKANEKSSFRTFTSIFCINLAVVYASIVLLALEQLSLCPYLGTVVIFSTSILPFTWHLALHSVFHGKVELKGVLLSFLAPVVVYLVFLLLRLGYYGDTLEHFLLQYESLDSGFLQFQVSMNQCFFLFSVILGIRSYRRLSRDFDTLFPDVESVRWIKHSGLVMAISAVLLHTGSIFLIDEGGLLVVPVLMVHFFIWLLISFIRYPEIFREFHIAHKAAQERAEAPESTSSPKLEQHAVEMDAYVAREQVYLKPDLDVQSLAAALHLKVYEVSSILNQVKGMNFNQYINQFRVEEAKRVLGTPEAQNKTIEAIGQEVGFKSKSTFYQAFKNFVGKTPSQYLKENLTA